LPVQVRQRTPIHVPRDAIDVPERVERRKKKTQRLLFR
jgi:hypothetical protein